MKATEPRSAFNDSASTCEGDTSYLSVAVAISHMAATVSCGSLILFVFFVKKSKDVRVTETQPNSSQL